MKVGFLMKPPSSSRGRLGSSEGLVRGDNQGTAPRISQVTGRSEPQCLDRSRAFLGYPLLHCSCNFVGVSAGIGNVLVTSRQELVRQAERKGVP